MSFLHRFSVDFSLIIFLALVFLLNDPHVFALFGVFLHSADPQFYFLHDVVLGSLFSFLFIILCFLSVFLGCMFLFVLFCAYGLTDIDKFVNCLFYGNFIEKLGWMVILYVLQVEFSSPSLVVFSSSYFFLLVGETFPMSA